MNCVKCGKEITDKRRKICKECAEKEKQEKEEMKAKKAKEKAEKDKSSKKEKKTPKSEKGNNEKKGIKLLITAIVIIVVCIIAGILLSRKGVGNTIGNIRNYGYSAINGGYVYYIAPNEDSTAVGIFKIKKDGTGESKELFMEDIDIMSMNVYNGYVYFIGINSDSYSEEDKLDNKIYRMKTNGDNLTVINDNEFNNDCYEIYVLNGYVYYIGTDNNIYKMSLDGSYRSLVSDNETGYLGITEKYIIYNVLEDGSEDYTTYIMNIDGTNKRPLIEGERLYSVNIDGNYVYYTNIDKQICKTEIDSGKSEVLLDSTAYNMNLYGDYIYFLNYKDIENEDRTVCLYKIKSDGSEKEATNIKELDTYSTFINIIGDWVIYMDSNETEGFVNLVRTDGKDEVCLYLLNYESYIDSQNTDTTENNQTNETSENPENTAQDSTSAQ